MAAKRLIARLSDIMEVENVSYSRAKVIYKVIKDSLGKERITLIDLAKYYGLDLVDLGCFLCISVGLERAS